MKQLMFEDYLGGNQSVFRIDAKHVLEQRAPSPELVFCNRDCQVTLHDDREHFSLIDINEQIMLEIWTYDNGDIVLASNHEWLAIHAFLQCFVLTRCENALEFRNFITLDYGWVRDPGMAELFKIKAAEAMKKSNPEMPPEGYISL